MDDAENLILNLKLESIYRLKYKSNSNPLYCPELNTDKPFNYAEFKSLAWGWSQDRKSCTNARKEETRQILTALHHCISKESSNIIIIRGVKTLEIPKSLNAGDYFLKFYFQLLEDFLPDFLKNFVVL